MQDKPKAVQGHSKMGFHPVVVELRLPCLACQCAIATEWIHCAQQQEEEEEDAHSPFGSVLCAMLPHDNFNVLEEVFEQGLLGLHLICRLLAVLHGSIPWRQGKHEPQLPPAVICCECFPVHHIEEYLHVGFDIVKILFRPSIPNQQHCHTKHNCLLVKRGSAQGSISIKTCKVPKTRAALYEPSVYTVYRRYIRLLCIAPQYQFHAWC